MVTSDFRSEVEIWLFRACSINIMQYNHYYRNSSVIVDSVPRNVFLVFLCFPFGGSYVCFQFALVLVTVVCFDAYLCLVVMSLVVVGLPVQRFA